MSLKDDAKAKSAAKITASDFSTGGDGHDLLTRAQCLCGAQRYDMRFSRVKCGDQRCAYGACLETSQ
jgi:hypothetical protein